MTTLPLMTIERSRAATPGTISGTGLRFSAMNESTAALRISDSFGTLEFPLADQFSQPFDHLPFFYQHMVCFEVSR